MRAGAFIAMLFALCGSASFAQPARLTATDGQPPLGASRVFGSLAFRGVTVGGLAFTPDGKQLITRGEGNVQFWNVETGELLRELTPADFGWTDTRCDAFALSPDGNRLACGGTGERLAVWDVEAGSLVFSRGRGEETRARDSSLCYSLDGKFILHGSGLKVARLHDAETGDVLHEFPVQGIDWASLVAYSPSGNFAAVTGGPGVYFIDLNKRQVTHLFMPHKRTIPILAFLPDDKLVTSGGVRGMANGREWLRDEIKVWDPATGELLRTIDIALDAERGRFSEALCLTPDGKQAIVKFAEDFRTYDLETGELRNEFRSPSASASEVGRNGMALSPDGRTIATAGDCSVVRLFDVATGERKWIGGQGHDHHVNRVTPSPDSARIATFSMDGRVGIWDAKTAELVWSFDCGVGSNVRDGCWSADGRYLYVVAQGIRTARSPGDAGSVIALDTRTRTRVFQAEITQSPWHCALSQDGKSLVVATAGQAALGSGQDEPPLMLLLDARTGITLREKKLESDPLSWSLKFSDDATQLMALANVGDDRMIVWDLESDEIARYAQAGGVDDGFRATAFAAGVPRAAVAEPYDKIAIVDTKTRADIRTIEVANTRINRLAISADGGRVAAYCRPTEVADGELRPKPDTTYGIHVWNTTTGKLVARIPNTGPMAWHLAISPDGRTVYVAMETGVILAWEVGGGG